MKLIGLSSGRHEGHEGAGPYRSSLTTCLRSKTWNRFALWAHLAGVRLYPPYEDAWAAAHGYPNDQRTINQLRQQIDLLTSQELNGISE